MKRQESPTMKERAEAAEAARALRRAIADPSTMGDERLLHIDFCQPRRSGWYTSWSNLPGFSRETVSGAYLYSHACLPGWVYKRHEVVTELIPDLELLAERGIRPSESTS